MAIISENEIKRITEKVIERFVLPDYERRGHNVTGELRDSFKAEARGTTGVIVGKHYAEYLVHGRPPNKDQSDDAIKNFTRWAGATFIGDWVEERGLKINPYALAWKIARDGTKIYEEGGSTLFEILDSAEVREFILQELGRAIRVNVNNVLRDSLNKLKKS